MKYLTLLALFMILGISRSLAQTGDEEPKRTFLNHKAEFEALKAKELRLTKADPNGKLDATAKRKLVLGSNAPAVGQPKKTAPVARLAQKSTGKIPSDISSTDAQQAAVAKAAQQPKIEAPVLEQERAAGKAPVTAPATPARISKNH